MMRRNTSVTWLAAASILATTVVLAPNGAAQSSTTGTVVGTIMDPTGAVVPRAEVQLMNVDTNALLTQVSGEAGGYVFPSVVPGTYRISVKLTGFRTAEITNVKVEVNKSLRCP